MRKIALILITIALATPVFSQVSPNGYIYYDYTNDGSIVGAKPTASVDKFYWYLAGQRLSMVVSDDRILGYDQNQNLILVVDEYDGDVEWKLSNGRTIVSNSIVLEGSVGYNLYHKTMDAYVAEKGKLND